MKICLLQYRFNKYGGGFGRYTVELAEQLCKEHEVHVVTTNYQYDAPRSPSITIHKIPLIIHEPIWARALAYDVYASKYVKRAKEEIGFDVVHTTSWFYPHDVATAQGSPFEFIIKTWDVDSPPERFFSKIIKRLVPFLLPLEKRNLRKNKKLISLTEKFRRELMVRYGVPEDRIAVVPIGVNLEEFKPDKQKRLEIRRKYGIGEEEIILSFVAHDFKRKGLKYLIRALPTVKDVKLFVIGRDDPRPYEVLAREIGVFDKVVFVGPAKKIGDYYSASDIFVFPTLYDPFGMVVMEAMASGLPVIISKEAGAAELIADGHDGLLLSDPTDPKVIAEKINSLCTDEKLRKKMGKNAREKAEKHSWDIIAKRTTEVYEEVIKKFS